MISPVKTKGADGRGTSAWKLGKFSLILHDEPDRFGHIGKVVFTISPKRRALIVDLQVEKTKENLVTLVGTINEAAVLNNKSRSTFTQKRIDELLQIAKTEIEGRVNKPKEES